MLWCLKLRIVKLGNEISIWESIFENISWMKFMKFYWVLEMYACKT